MVSREQTHATRLMEYIWILQENVFGYHSSTFDSPRDYPRIHLTTCEEIEKYSLKLEGRGTIHTSEDR